MSITDKLIEANENAKANSTAEASPENVSAPDPKAILSNNLMIVQLAAYYVEYGDAAYREAYLEKTEELGIDREEAIKIFNFECDVCRKYNKKYLLKLDFVKSWFMKLRHPFFFRYPKTKDEICKELFLTVGELCKFIDEAEWHFWNSHHRPISDEVWEEIYEWRLQGKGGRYVIDVYLPAVCEKYSVSMDDVWKVVNHYGPFLCRHKWG